MLSSSSKLAVRVPIAGPGCEVFVRRSQPGPDPSKSVGNGTHRGSVAPAPGEIAGIRLQPALRCRDARQQFLVAQRGCHGGGWLFGKFPAGPNEKDEVPCSSFTPLA